MNKAINEKISRNLEIFKARAASAGFPFKEEPTLSWDLKGHTAGTACKNHVRLNQELVTRYENEITYQTWGHELVHVLQWQYNLYIENGRTAIHGKNFKRLCKILGISDSTTHNMKTVSARKTRKFNYFCGCDTPVTAGIIVHNKVQKGALGYHCKQCKLLLVNMKWEEV